ncbi:Hypothetical predicted protein, partial [Olea europaea subsp. europaea]
MDFLLRLFVRDYSASPKMRYLPDIGYCRCCYGKEMGGDEGFEIVLNMGKEQSTTSLGFTTRLK